MRHLAINQKLASCILLVFANAASAQTGHVYGTVVSEYGSPVAAVKVTAKLISDNPVVRAIKYVETDASGHFQIDHLAWGEYKLFTQKVSDGYPNSASTFYSNASAPRIRLTPQNQSATVTLNLGPKAGVVRGTIVDGVTGAPVDASVRLWRISNPNFWLEKPLRSQYLLLIPPNASIGMEVSAEGYASWYYPGAPAPGQALKEASNQVMVLDVRLTPVQR